MVTIIPTDANATRNKALKEGPLIKISGKHQIKRYAIVFWPILLSGERHNLTVKNVCIIIARPAVKVICLEDKYWPSANRKNATVPIIQSKVFERRNICPDTLAEAQTIERNI